MRLASSGIALVLACFAVSGHATSTVPVDGSSAGDADSSHAKYERQQRERFDLLRNDGSPRVQVLAGRIYLDGDDPANRLLPKSADVVARAVRLAPDDAVVQWAAADQGSYASSACGPTDWPDAEVANLVRLEPDNAAAWQYAVALAAAKGDAARVDDALAHMAAATRASDHQADVAKTWTKVYADHPELLNRIGADDEAYDYGDDAPARPAAATLAFLDALQQAQRYASTIDGALESACKPDANSETTWQRADWCARAGQLLATRGNSFDLRDTGLKMLAAAGATPDDLVDLRRNRQWLVENAAVPMRNLQLFAELDTVVADWNGAADEIAATHNRLKRLGKPLTPPAGWVARADTDDAGKEAGQNAWTDYLGAVVDDLRSSADVRERALGLSVRSPREESAVAAVDAAAPDATHDAAHDAAPNSAASATALADLAAANPDNAFVQWIAATQAKGNDDAVAAVQRLQPANAAAWTLALKSAGESADALHRAAQATRFDDGSGERILLLHAAFMRRPMPAGQQVPWLEQAGLAESDDAPKVVAFANAMMLAASNMQVAPMSNAWQTCREVDAAKDAAIAADCVKIARLMLHSQDSLVAAMFGGGLLRTLGALEGADREYARQLYWWQTSGSAMQEKFGRFIDDYLATGSEIEAMRRLMASAGKLDPPADWQPPHWKKAAASANAK